MVTFPFRTPALSIEQPLGRFYLVSLPADLLLQVAESSVMAATLNDDGIGYTLEGNQRVIKDDRLSQIGAYIDRSDSSFPNSIILAANLSADDGYGVDENAGDDGDHESNSHTAWEIQKQENGCNILIIPTANKLASIIDGQHRLFAFAKAKIAQRRSMQLACAVFLDLPRPFQAQLFATINSTQKRVDKSLTYEMFGYNIDDEQPEYWTPDKLAVFLARKLGTEVDSALKGRITVAPKRDPSLLEMNSSADWRVSTAVVVEGILRLYSTNPKRDSNKMLTPHANSRSILRDGPQDRSPFRRVFIDGNDNLIYILVRNYLSACQNLFWSKAPPESFITRTVGVQALFDVMRRLGKLGYDDKDISVPYFENLLEPASKLDFSIDLYRNASGSGRSTIRRAIERCLLPA